MSGRCSSTVRLFWRDDGDPTGAPVLFLNSLGTDLRLWDPLLPQLPRGRRILRCDTRGHGLSDAPPGPYALDALVDDVEAHLNHHQVRGLVVIGLSLGGLMAQALAARRPDLVRGLVLSNTAPKLGDADLWRARIDTFQATGMEGAADAILDRWFSPAFRADPAACGPWEAMLKATPADGYVGCCAALAESDLTAETARLTVPTLVIGGALDVASPPALTRALAETIEGARYVEIPNAGHLPVVEHPAVYGEHLRRFFAELAPRDRAVAGDATRRAVLSDAHVDAAASKSTPLDAAFQTLITEGAWGTVWASDGLTRRERSMLTLALLAATGNFEEIPMHIRATARTGATADDVAEAFQHVAIYSGVPRANHALKLAKRVFKEMEGGGPVEERIFVGRRNK